MLRSLAFLALAVFVGACTAPSKDNASVDLGAFRLGHTIVVAPNVQKVPGSRDVEAQEWIDLLKNAVVSRFDKYEGDQLYHFGISVEGFFVAPGGVPIILSPKSVLAIKVTVWDDAANAKLNESPKTFTIFESTTGKSALLGSGYARTREEQMQGLVTNAAHEIESWMATQRQEKGWFEPRSAPVHEETPQASAATPGPRDENTGPSVTEISE